MKRAEELRVGDKVTVRPSWSAKEDNDRRISEETAVVEYIHPEGRFCTVRLKCGLTDTIPLAPAGKIAEPDDLPEGYTPVRNKYLRDRLKFLHVRQQDVGAAMGKSKSWLGDRLSQELTKAEQREILEAAERVAAERGRKQ